ncbi:MAG: hypothetical protein CUR33_16720 [Pseudomonas sp.]|uniref:hypothetical protein n=1 Tax=Pseudomonas sp. FEMGT703P TaxID=2080764 RepID=UPI000CB11B04|nr:hypothetical protein [Pseudomonas sp. FEMGT703P]PJE40632.1 MAG: hypothetical protein CUR33_16720 [Pseudomonas sp.] [Pseudomonas sp. FEMGT703P]
MSLEEQITFTSDQQVHLNAWSSVYIDAHIQQRLGITLSQFLINPGKYLFLAWLTAPHIPTNNGFLPLLPAQVAASRRIHQRWAEEEEED